MQASTFRGFVVGLATGLAIGVGYIAPWLTDKIADRVIEKMTIDAGYVVPTIPALKLDVTMRLRVAATPHTLAERYCLAKNIFHEAGVEDYEGKLAVGQVTMNRIGKRKAWGDSICKVVYAPYQFSWTLDKNKRAEVPTGPLWEESKRAAREVLDGTRLPEFVDSLFYHTDYIDAPNWASPNNVIAQVGRHIFYSQDLKL